ncbi:MAG: polysaccharide biosynthesis C-terminal domain-containing protein [Planctomycetes bacterium]|nr:polysaccharide biosynthesis C-terminal domain-containing protein [Planctomycetota bacterium]
MGKIDDTDPGVRTSIIVSGLVSLSKIGGFVRTVAVGWFIGSTLHAGIYLFVEWTLHLASAAVVLGIPTSIIASYTSTRETNGRDEASRSASKSIIAVLIPVALLIVLAEFFAQPLIDGLTDYRERGEDALLFAVKLARWIAPLMVVMILSEFFKGILYAENRVLPPTLSPLLQTLSVLIALILFYEDYGIEGLAVGFIVGYVLQCLLLYAMCRRTGFRFHPTLFVTSALRGRFMKLFLLTMLANGLAQGMLLVDISMSTTVELEEESVASLLNAHRFLFPFTNISSLMIGGVGMAFIAEYKARNDLESLRDYVRRMMALYVYFFLPLSAFFAVCSSQVVNALFASSAEYSAEGLLRTAECFAYYSLGLLFAAGSQLFFTASLALEKYRATFIVGILGFAVNFGLNFVLRGAMGVSGIALSTTIVTLLTLVLLMTSVARAAPGILRAPKIAGEMARFALLVTIATIATFALDRGIMTDDFIFETVNRFAEVSRESFSRSHILSHVLRIAVDGAVFCAIVATPVLRALGRRGSIARQGSSAP